MGKPMTAVPAMESRAIVRRCRGALLAIGLFSFCINLLMLTASIYMMQVFDRVMVSRSVETLLLLTFIAFAALSAMAALDIVRSRIMQRLGAWIDERISPVVLGIGLVGSSGMASGAPGSGMRDLVEIKTFISGSAVLPVLDAPWTPVFLLFMFALHPVLGLMALGGAVVLLAMAFLNDFSTREATVAAGAASGRALRFAETAFQRADVVLAMGMRAAALGRWQVLNRDAVAANDVAGLRSGTISGTTRFLRQVLQISVLGAGAWLAIEGRVSPGAMIAASILMGRALAPVDQAISAWRSARSALDAFRRVAELLDGAADRTRAAPEASTLPAPRGAVSVEAATVVRKGMDRPALRNVTFEVAPGEVLAVIGPSAAGKTTLGRLIVGAEAPHAGHVRLDGLDVSAWDAELRGRHVGYLPQDVALIGDTVRDAIARLTDAADEDVIAAARLAGVHETIMRLPQGYDTPLGPEGAALSGGERQRVALARAVFGDPCLVLLDEPNANLDADGERGLHAAIAALKARGTTVILVAHRPSVLRSVERILILQEGAARMIGPRDEVLARINQANAAPSSVPGPVPVPREAAPQRAAGGQGG